MFTLSNYWTVIYLSCSSVWSESGVQIYFFQPSHCFRPCFCLHSETSSFWINPAKIHENRSYCYTGPVSLKYFQLLVTTQFWVHFHFNIKTAPSQAYPSKIVTLLFYNRHQTTSHASAATQVDLEYKRLCSTLHMLISRKVHTGLKNTPAFSLILDAIFLYCLINFPPCPISRGSFRTLK